MVQEHADVGRQIARVGLIAAHQLLHDLPAGRPIAAGQIEPGQLQPIFGIGLRRTGIDQALRQFHDLGVAHTAGIVEQEADLETLVLRQREGEPRFCSTSASACLSLE